jgi:hypothetical protein
VVNAVPGAGDAITVRVIRPTGRDPYGDPLAGTGGQWDVDGCLFAPGPSTEVIAGANTVDSDGTIYGPPGMDVQPADRIVVRGDSYSVVGRKQDWGQAGTVVVLRYVTG